VGFATSTTRVTAQTGFAIGASGGTELLVTLMALGHWLNAAGLQVMTAACARRQPAVSRVSSHILLAAAIGLAIDCDLLKS